jgi:site-specific DNA recombinase
VEVVACYARVSSDGQREKGTIETQLDAVREEAERRQWELREFVDDGVCGAKPFAERPGWRGLLAGARRGEFSSVAAYNTERIGRDAFENLQMLRELAALGMTIISVMDAYQTGTPQGNAAFGHASVSAQEDREKRTIYTSRGRRRVAKIDNRWVGGPAPYGYDVIIVDRKTGSQLIIDEVEAAVVRQMFAWACESWSGKRIAAELNKRGIPYNSMGPRDAKTHERRAGTWNHATVSRLLRNETYAGRATYGRRSKKAEVVYRDVPAIVPQSVFLAAKAAIAEQHRWSGAHAKRTYHLRGLMKCARAGHSLIGRMWRHDAVYYCDACPSGGARPVIRETPMLEILWKDVLDFLQHPNEAVRAMARANSEQGTFEDRTERELVDLARRLHELEDREGQLVELRLAKTITPAVLDKKAKELHAQAAQLRGQMEAVQAARTAAVRAVEESDAIRKLLGQLRQQAVRADKPTRVQIIRLLTRSIIASRVGGHTSILITYFGRPAAARVAPINAS